MKQLFQPVVLNLVDHLRRQNELLRNVLAAYSGRSAEEAVSDYLREKDLLPLLAARSADDSHVQFNLF